MPGFWWNSDPIRMEWVGEANSMFAVPAYLEAFTMHLSQYRSTITTPDSLKCASTVAGAAHFMQKPGCFLAPVMIGLVVVGLPMLARYQSATNALRLTYSVLLHSEFTFFLHPELL